MEKIGKNMKQMLPRSKLNPFFSSPLYLDTRNPQLPVVAKIAFIQGFINKLRNKVQRVDLLSNGFGFVINAVDLEECVNYLNKGLVGFAEKEIKNRTESFSYVYDVLNTKNQAQEKEIEALKMKIL